MGEPDTVSHPRIASFIFGKQYLVHLGPSQQHKIRPVSIGQVVARGGIGSRGVARVDGADGSPRTDIGSGKVSIVRLDAEGVEGLVPEAMRGRVLERVRDVDWPICADDVMGDGSGCLLRICCRCMKPLALLEERSVRTQ